MKEKTPKLLMAILFCLTLFVFPRCTFDYGDAASENDDQADIVMGNLEYVRMRDGEPVVRFRAQQAERYENRQTMELQNFSFEQFYDHGREVNATGSAGSGLVELDSGNIQLDQNIIIAVDSEDITIETESIFWEDEKRILSGNDEHPVDIQRSDGTVFSGRGFTADSRSRSWSFSGGVEGSYVDTEPEEDETPEAAEDGVTEVGIMEDGVMDDGVMNDEVAEEELFRELEDFVLAPPDEAGGDAADLP
jgi:LPS export ABC transporter protein LptC